MLAVSAALQNINVVVQALFRFCLVSAYNGKCKFKGYTSGDNTHLLKYVS